MPRGDGTGPMGIGLNGWGRGGCIGLQGDGGFGSGFWFGRGMRRWQTMPCQQAALDIDLLEGRAELLERQAAVCRTMANKARGAAPKTD